MSLDEEAERRRAESFVIEEQSFSTVSLAADMAMPGSLFQPSRIAMSIAE
jgi:hypothetical protein